jgi:hypothetical protein
MIVNSQRNSNTLVQGSSINGGTLAQNFNLQGMSIINSYFHVKPPVYTGRSLQNANQSVLLNEYTGNPILLPVGSCIVSIVICTNEIITCGSGNIPCLITYGPTPKYNYNTGIWEPKDTTQSVTSILDFTLIDLQNGISSTPFSNAVNAYPSLIAFMGTTNINDHKTIIPPNSICKVKLLLINPTLAQ